MFFVIDKPQLQRVIAIIRDDRTKKMQGLAGPFMRLEARDDYLQLNGLEVSATIPATVYEPGVLFLKVTAFRRLLRTIKGQKFLSIQVMSDGLLMENIRLPLEPNEMLLYPNPDQAPELHPSVALIEAEPEKPKPEDTQMTFWSQVDEDETEERSKEKK